LTTSTLGLYSYAKLPFPMRSIRFVLGLISLLLVSSIPLLGLLFGGWQAPDLLFCFWIESFVVGIFTMLKLAKYPDRFLLYFFPVHYGMFMLVHLIFLVAGAYLNFFGVPFVSDPISLVVGTFIFGLGCFGSHGISYLSNFLHGREWERRTNFYYFILPYGRILPMHLAIIFGALAGFAPLLLLIIKYVVDVLGYCLEHATLPHRSSVLRGQRYR